MSEQVPSDHRVSVEEVRPMEIADVLASAVGARGNKYLILRFKLADMTPRFVVRTRARVTDQCGESTFVFLDDAIDAYNRAPGP